MTPTPHETSAFTVEGGEIFQNGIHRDPDLCRALLASYRRDARVNDWWSKHAARRAEQLALAMREAGQQQTSDQVQ